MGGTFNSKGRGYAWKRDDIAERIKADREAAKLAEYRTRVVGRRVVVTSHVDFGNEGEIVGFEDGLFAVKLDNETDAQFFTRDELSALRR